MSFPATVDSVTPNTGSTAGGTPVSVAYTHFIPDTPPGTNPVTQVFFGPDDFTSSITSNPANGPLLLTTPAHAAGTLAVSVVDSFGQSTITQNFTFAAGDPHFVGFDGVQFDYHGIPGNDYLLWLDNDTYIKSTFDSPGELCPAWAHNTFMTKLIINDQVITVDDLLESNDEEVKAKTGLVRGLPEQINISGDIKGMKIIETASVKIIITSMQIDRFMHLNLAIESYGQQASGILGQTLLPIDKRLPNDMFKV